MFFLFERRYVTTLYSGHTKLFDCIFVYLKREGIIQRCNIKLCSGIFKLRAVSASWSVLMQLPCGMNSLGSISV